MNDEPNSELEPKPNSLIEQARVLARASHEIRERVRSDKLRIMADHRERIASINNLYESQLSEAIATIEQKHGQALDQANDMLHQQLAEHEMLAIKLGRIG